MEDQVGRRINYLRVSVTDLCNLRCRYCMPEEGIEKKRHGEILSLEEIFEIIKASVTLGVNKVRITGGEPLVRKDIVSLIENIGKLEEIKDIALTTNGVLLKQFAQDLKNAGLMRVNISLDTLKEDKYKEITRGGRLEQVLDGIEEAKKAGLYPIKINTVLIGGFNDDEIERFAQLTVDEEIHVRFIELMPLGQASSWAKSNFLSNAFIKEQLPDLIPVHEGDKSSPARYYKLPGAKGKIGLINPISSHFCKYCNRIRLTADGRLKPCLHSNQEIDLKEVVRERKDDLREMLTKAILQKPQQHTLNQLDNEPVERDMFRIGG
ncbi:MAG: GTP 3',8-cyclase MoaA [Bacillota bacterium]